jgi:(Z)-2-((N-methylformamido)methylene)-5-hydroxybutyrolactone dehydrogenase
MKTYQHWINGESVRPASGEWLDSIDPYRGDVWARIPRGNSKDVDLAVQSAKKAMEVGPWQSMSPSERGDILRKIGDLLCDADVAQMLADTESRDNGKILAEMQGQLRYLPRHWFYFAGLADKVEGAVIPVDKRDMLAMTYREPVGVVAALTAWNSPLMFFTIKCAPALAAGCSVVLKPSEYASASSLEFAALTKKAGLPDGVLNVVTGLGHELGTALVEHPDISKVTFTGSDATGAKVYESAARTMKRVSMELGGKSPNIVFEDADMDSAVVGAVAGIFGAAGQMCTAGSRLLVQNTVREEFTERVVEMARTLKLGDPMSADTDIGPIATAAQFKKINDYVDLANREGARCILGGRALTDTGPAQFFEPTVFTDVKSSMRIAQEEVFGPVLSVLGFDDECDAVKIGNDVIYGLAAGVWTRDLGRAVRMSRALKAGMVWVNTYRAYSFTVPIGGQKQSGLGRESGLEAINEYLETKSVMISTASGLTGNPFVQR